MNNIIPFPGNQNPVRRVLFPEVVFPDFHKPAAVAQYQQYRVDRAILLNAPMIIATAMFLGFIAGMWGR